MKKEEFHYMDKINEANAFEKIDVCTKDLFKQRD